MNAEKYIFKYSIITIFFLLSGCAQSSIPFVSRMTNNSTLSQLQNIKSYQENDAITVSQMINKIKGENKNQKKQDQHVYDFFYNSEEDYLNKTNIALLTSQLNALDKNYRYCIDVYMGPAKTDDIYQSAIIAYQRLKKFNKVFFNKITCHTEKYQPQLAKNLIIVQFKKVQENGL